MNVDKYIRKLSGGVQIYSGTPPNDRDNATDDQCHVEFGLLEMSAEGYDQVLHAT